jgi:hypothetical protein
MTRDDWAAQIEFGLIERDCIDPRDYGKPGWRRHAQSARKPDRVRRERDTGTSGDQAIPGARNKVWATLTGRPTP